MSYDLADCPNIVISKKLGEYRVAYKISKYIDYPFRKARELQEESAYYTTDLADAHNTARLMQASQK